MFPPNGIVHFNSLAELKTTLERKRAAIQQMCQGLEEYLTIDLDNAIQEIERPAPESARPVGLDPYRPEPYKPSDEDFAKLCDQVQIAENRIEEARTALSGLKEDGPEGAMRASLNMQIGYFEDTLRSLTATRDHMQRIMEAHREEAK